MFLSVTQDVLIRRIDLAQEAILFAAPAISGSVASALIRARERLSPEAITVLLDVDEDAYRVGYGDLEGARLLDRMATTVRLRRQPGLRLGLLRTDGEVLVWAPVPLAVERERSCAEPNGVLISSRVSENGDPMTLLEASSKSAPDPILCSDSAVVPSEAQGVIQRLEESPPGPFNLSRVTRVFSCHYQFVEVELKGAEWAGRELKLSSVLLNSDVPPDLRELLETRFKPFKALGDKSIQVPDLVKGDLAYRADGSPILASMTQREVRSLFDEIRERYLHRVGKFGWIVKRAQKADFERELRAFQEVLRMWVIGFRKLAQDEENALLDQLAHLILDRMDRAAGSAGKSPYAVREMVAAGLRRMRVFEPSVELIVKSIAPESASDSEFLDALKAALSPEDLETWYQEFNAARESDETPIGSLK